MGLSALEMEAVAELTNDAALYAMDAFPSDQHPALIAYLYSLRRQENLTMLFSGHLPSITRLSNLVFTNKPVEQYVLLVTAYFFAKLGDTKTRYPLLVDNLAEAIGFIKAPDDKTQAECVAFVTKDYLDDVPSIDDVRDIMMDNRWATTIALLILYIMPMNGFQEIYKTRQEEERKQALAEQRKPAA